MPNGKPGDHWYTDIVVHGLPAFSPEVDGLIAALDESDAHGLHQDLEGLVDAYLEEIAGDLPKDIAFPERYLSGPQLVELKTRLEDARRPL